MGKEPDDHRADRLGPGRRPASVKGSRLRRPPGEAGQSGRPGKAPGRVDQRTRPRLLRAAAVKSLNQAISLLDSAAVQQVRSFLAHPSLGLFKHAIDRCFMIAHDSGRAGIRGSFFVSPAICRRPAGRNACGGGRAVSRMRKFVVGRATLASCRSRQLAGGRPSLSAWHPIATGTSPRSGSAPKNTHEF